MFHGQNCSVSSFFWVDRNYGNSLASHEKRNFFFWNAWITITDDSYDRYHGTSVKVERFHEIIGTQFVGQSHILWVYLKNLVQQWDLVVPRDCRAMFQPSGSIPKWPLLKVLSKIYVRMHTTNAYAYLNDSAGENRERERANRGKQEVNKPRRGSRNAQSHHKSNNFSPLLYVHQQRIGLHAHSLLSLSSIKFSQLVPCVVKSGRWDGKTCLSDTNWSSLLLRFIYVRRMRAMRGAADSHWVGRLSN